MASNTHKVIGKSVNREERKARQTQASDPDRKEQNQRADATKRMPATRGPVFWWTIGLLLFALVVALLWYENMSAVYG